MKNGKLNVKQSKARQRKECQKAGVASRSGRLWERPRTSSCSSSSFSCGI